MQFFIAGRVFGDQPWRFLRYVLIRMIGHFHDLAQRFTKFTRFVKFLDFGHGGQAGLHQLAGFRVLCAKAAVKTLGDKARRTAGDIHVFADQVGIHARDKIIRIHVQIFDLGIEFGGKIIAQPFRVHADFQIAQRRDAGAARLRHLFAGDRDKTMRIHIVRRLVAREFQHGGPEQRMEVSDVLADEMDLLGARVRHERIKIAADFAEIIFQRSQIADRRIEPDVEILARLIRNLDTKVRRIAADIPVAQTAFTFQPFFAFIRHFGLQAVVLQGPAA